MSHPNIHGGRRQGIVSRGVAAVTGAALLALPVFLSQPARAVEAPAKVPSGAVQVAPGDWPQWQGANRDGKSAETGLLKQWPEKGPPLAWRATGMGTGDGGVAVVGGRIYTTGDAPDGAYLRALDEADGKEVWKAKIGKTGTASSPAHPGPQGTPTVADGRVYVLGQFGDLVCFEAADGKTVWHKNVGKDLGGKMMSGWGWAESPLVDGNRVVVTPGGTGGTLAALNKATGELLWRSNDWTDLAGYASVIPADLGGVRQYIQLTDKSVAGVNAENGKILWKAARPGKTAVIPTVVYQDGYVYTTSGYGVGCDLFKVTAAGGKFAVEKVYSNQLIKNHHGGVVLVDGKIYGHSDNVGWVCQDFKTGEAVWKDKEQMGKGTVTYADGHLYLRQENGPGTIALIEASPAGYKETGRFNPPDRTKTEAWAHLVIANGKLYVRDQDTLLCYDVKAK